MRPILKLLITFFLLTSSFALGASMSKAAQLTKVCHGKKRLIEPNFTIDSNRTFALIESSVVALKGLSPVIKTKPGNVQMAFGEVSAIFALYGIETGPYSVTVYSFDKDGFQNDEHLFEGHITKGQTLVQK